MAFRVEEFRASFNKPARTNSFEVLILPKNIDTPPYRFDDLRFRIESTELPGRATTAIDHSYYGPVQKLAGGAVYTDLTMTVLLSEDYKEAEYFYTWTDTIVGNHRRNPRFAGPASSRGFNVNYLDNYTNNVIIRVFNELGSVKRTVTLVDAYPTLTSPVNLSWNNNEIARMNVTMTFRYWQTEVFEDIPDPSGPIAVPNTAQFERQEQIEKPKPQSPPSDPIEETNPGYLDFIGA